MRSRRNGLLLGGLLGVAVGMVGLSFAAVPLYRVFCQVTGFGGTTQRAEQGASRVLDRTIEIRFNADTDKGLSWSFHPNERSVRLKIGETGLTTFNARNLTDQTLVGSALYNVTPEKVGQYFNKVQCFCFTQQTLKPHESADLPVAFYVDPAIAEDRNLDDVTVITLSYTFYKAQNQTADAAAKTGTAATPAANPPGGSKGQSGALAATPPVE